MSAVETAVILAAGMGLRLEDLGRRIPKGFLQIGEQPIVEESILRLRAAGVRRVIVITGHLAGHYEGLVQRYPGLVETTHNPRFAETGSLESLCCIGSTVPGNYLLLESDLIYEQRALTECRDCPHDNVILISGRTQSGDEVYVTSRGGLLTGMSKRREDLADPVIGELVGISKISPALHAELLRVAANRRPPGGWSRCHYETDGLVAAAPSIPIHVHLVEDLIWSEIDDSSHLARARSRVYPAILAADPLRP